MQSPSNAEIFSVILKAPSYIKELKDFQLELFATYVDRQLKEAQGEMALLRRANPDRPMENCVMSQSFEDAKKVTEIVKAEISRRSHPQPQRVKPGRKKNDPLPFDAFFKDTGSLERFLLACVSAGIICKDGEGFLWIDEGAKGHRVRAMWEAAKDLGIQKKNLPNTKAVCNEIKRFFNMKKLSPTTLDELNTINKEFQKMKAEIQKKFRESKG